VAVALATLAAPAARALEADVMKLLENRQCAACRLQDADLVWADLRDANLTNAKLQRANLSQARLDGAVLRGADLRFTSLQGASLRGADLRGAQLLGTDLRQSDLSGAQLDPGALERSHWDGAQGLESGMLSYAAVHNAGVAAALSGRQPEAERLFGEAVPAEDARRARILAFDRDPFGLFITRGCGLPIEGAVEGKACARHHAESGLAVLQMKHGEAASRRGHLHAAPGGPQGGQRCGLDATGLEAHPRHAVREGHRHLATDAHQEVFGCATGAAPAAERQGPQVERIAIEAESVDRLPDRALQQFILRQRRQLGRVHQQRRTGNRDRATPSGEST
jgi:hypothetical protein